MELGGLTALLKTVVDMVTGFKSRRDEKRQANLKERVIADMRHAQHRNVNPTATLLASAETLAARLGVQVSALVPALDELEREGRIFYDTMSRGYSLQPTPWSHPSRPIP